MIAHRGASRAETREHAGRRSGAPARWEPTQWSSTCAVRATAYWWCTTTRTSMTAGSSSTRPYADLPPDRTRPGRSARRVRGNVGERRDQERPERTRFRLRPSPSPTRPSPTSWPAHDDHRWLDLLLPAGDGRSLPRTGTADPHRLAVRVEAPGGRRRDAGGEGALALHPWVDLLTRETIDDLPRRGRAGEHLDVRRPARMAELIEWGIDGICTNVPDVAIEARRGCTRRANQPDGVGHVAELERRGLAQVVAVELVGERRRRGRW